MNAGEPILCELADGFGSDVGDNPLSNLGTGSFEDIVVFGGKHAPSRQFGELLLTLGGLFGDIPIA